MKSKNREYLNTVYKKYGKFHACAYLGQKWLIYPDDFKATPNLEVSHREILPFEVVFDFDVDDKEKISFYLKKLLSNLRHRNVPYTVWKTGGKGVHVHTYWPEIAKYHTEDRSLVKRHIIDFFTSNRDGSGESWAKHCKIDYQLCTRHMIRAGYGTHEKTGNRKEMIDHWSHAIWSEAELPKKLIARIKEELEGGKKKNIVLTGTGVKKVKFKAIEYMLSQDFAGLKDGRKRALNILSSYFYANDGVEGFETIREWNDYKLNRYFSEAELVQTFKGIAKMVERGRAFGITSIRDLMRELRVPSDKYEGTL